VSTDRQGIRGLGIEAQQAAVEGFTSHSEVASPGAVALPWNVLCVS
jgi:hypothetical protein